MIENKGFFSRLFNPQRNAEQTAGCHGGSQVNTQGLREIAIVGSPNVGKSVIFNRLTGAYVTVSNYPGTTVEVSRGKGSIGGEEFAIVDTPGMYSLLPITEEERVARSILLEEEPVAVIHVVDAKNLQRMLPLTLQLIEARLPVLLDVNIMDEAERLGIQVDITRLEEELGIPVVGTVGTTGRGIDLLRKRLSEYVNGGNSEDRARPSRYDEAIETVLEQLDELLQGEYLLSRRAIGLLLLQGDQEVQGLVREREGEAFGRIREIVADAQTHRSRPLSYVLTMQRRELAKRILAQAVTYPSQVRIGFGERLSRAMMNPLTGIPILLMVLYFGLYQFVGVFGAQTVVDFLESVVFEGWINPWVDRAAAIIPWPVLRELFAGQYGIITLGVRYAIALILPIVGTFFIAFSIIEDTGYLPRLAMLIDRIFKKIGLNGRAVIPMVLGFGCDTMATMVTRTLETRRERLIATLLLALAIPCSAQLGVILAILSGRPRALAVWAGVVMGIFLLVGYLAARLMPGKRPSFYMELPPLRWPVLSNILAKTYARLEWYFLEVFPLFIWASVLIWVGRVTGLFDLIIAALEPLVRLIGLPNEAAVTFLFGFFRRDYGAAGLYDLQQGGGLSGVQLAVAAVTLTLFVPCIAQFSMMLKERGAKVALAIVAFIFPFAFLVGGLLNLTLTALGVVL